MLTDLGSLCLGAFVIGISLFKKPPRYFELSATFIPHLERCAGFMYSMPYDDSNMKIFRLN